MTDHYQGVVIEESLRDKSVLKKFTITSTKVEPVTDEHKTPWLKQWTLHTVEVPETEIISINQAVSKALEPNYWYADFKNNAYHFVIFPGKVFRLDRSKPEQYERWCIMGPNSEYLTISWTSHQQLSSGRDQMSKRLNQANRVQSNKTQQVIAALANSEVYQKASENYWLRGLIQGIPGIGGPLETWFFGEADRVKKQRVEEGILLLAQGLEALSAELIDMNRYIEEYAFLFERALGYVATDYRQDMREAYIRMLARMATKPFEKLDMKEYYLDLVASLTPTHLRLLRYMGEGKKIGKTGNPITDFVVARAEEEGMPRNLAEDIVGDLVSKNLIKVRETQGWSGHTAAVSAEITSSGLNVLALILEIT